IKSTKNVFHPQDILYGKLRPYLNKVHFANADGICSTDIYVLRAKERRIRPDLASYFLRAPAVLSAVSAAMEGANLPRVGSQALLRVQLPIPPMEEQDRLVTLLDEADELRKLRSE